jgi:hypothetical protein
MSSRIDTDEDVNQTLDMRRRMNDAESLEKQSRFFEAFVANVLLSSSAMNKAFNPKVRKSERERKIK